jgi:methyl-accepting chemotaxis protein
MKSIRARLVLGLGLIIVFFVVQAVWVWQSQSTAKNNVVETTRKNTLASAQLSEVAVLAQQVRRYEKEYFVYVGNEERRNSYIKEWTGTFDKINQSLAAMRSNVDKAFDTDDVTKITDWQRAVDFYGAEMQRIFSTVDAQAARISQNAGAPTPAGAAAASAPAMLSPMEVNTMIGPGKDRLSGVLIKGVSAMVTEKTQQTLALSSVAAGGFNRVFAGVMLTVVVGIVIALILMLTLPRTVTIPLKNLTVVVDDLSRGKLDTKIETGSVAEFAGLASALERMRVGQQAMLARLRRTA